MKALLIITCIFIGSVLVYSQQAKSNFPPGLEYTYDAIPLDSLNNQIISEMFFRRDLFGDVAEYEGKLANIVFTKEALTQDSLDIKPYLDSLFFHFDGTDGYEYFQTGTLEDFLRSIDSLGLDPNFSFLDFFRSLRSWYSVYRFSATVNDEYNLLSIDTVFAGFNIRFEYLGERFPDEIINTMQGSFDCKKFLISWKIGIVLPPPLPPIDLISTNDTVWVVPGNEFWMVQDIVPTNHIDLQFLGIDPFSIPGLFTGDVLIVSQEDERVIPTEIALEQNYPNPFNPNTTIKFSLPTSGYASLIIYNALGEEVAVLLDKELTTGTYDVEWNAKGFTSGIYFYQLNTERYIETKKMIYMK
ncbi:MAG: T9SS type A sorting domain-containing protein [Candidatus Kariarchaeaceae archaeon]|jgi:hypothetical protein